ncbi:MAG TPA: 4Fe-4S dicluster domain-containing protein [Selenomonadales bacterium]|nr:4Fe-4S dicluster domain-containing protein [Selenomonadales bacterium]
MKEMEARLATLEFRPDDDWQHVAVIDQETCRNCELKNCLLICPSGVFRWNYVPDDPVLVFYRQCVECGACRLVCPKNNIALSFPHGGYGVIYREG